MTKSETGENKRKWLNDEVVVLSSLSVSVTETMMKEVLYDGVVLHSTGTQRHCFNQDQVHV